VDAAMTRPNAAVDVFLAIADPTRRRLLDQLGRRGEQSVNRLARHFDTSLSAVSQHLRLLREAGLVTVRQSGRERLYQLNARPLRRVADWIAFYDRFWQEKLDALGEHLKRNP
jgi:DNA-binding transcriptional ArsR family regulator